MLIQKERAEPDTIRQDANTRGWKFLEREKKNGQYSGLTKSRIPQFLISLLPFPLTFNPIPELFPSHFESKNF